MVATRKLFYVMLMGLTFTSCNSTSNPVYPNKLEVDVTELKLKKNESKDVTCTILPSNFDYKSTNLKISGGEISGETYFTATDKLKEGTTNVHIISVTAVTATVEPVTLRLAINGEKEEIVKEVKVTIENVYTPPTTITPEKTEVNITTDDKNVVVSYTYGPEGSSGECVKALLDATKGGVICACITDTVNKQITIVPVSVGEGKINIYSLLSPDDSDFTADKIKATISVTITEPKK